MAQVLVEFDCDVEGDGDDGWEDDVGDESNQEPGKIEAGNEEVNEEDMAGPGKIYIFIIFSGKLHTNIYYTITDFFFIRKERTMIVPDQ